MWRDQPRLPHYNIHILAAGPPCVFVHGPTQAAGTNCLYRCHVPPSLIWRKWIATSSPFWASKGFHKDVTWSFSAVKAQLCGNQSRGKGTLFWRSLCSVWTHHLPLLNCLSGNSPCLPLCHAQALDMKIAYDSSCWHGINSVSPGEWISGWDQWKMAELESWTTGVFPIQ